MGGANVTGITTHVLDTSRGVPAEGVDLSLSVLKGDDWREIARVRTDVDGRAQAVPEGGSPEAGTYRLRFETGAWLAAQGVEVFHPWVEVTFDVRDPSRHHHIPLLLSPFGYTTYRGS